MLSILCVLQITLNLWSRLFMISCDVYLQCRSPLILFRGRNHQTIQTSHQADSLGPAHNSHWMIATALLPWCGDKTIDIDWPILPRINARSYQTKHLTSWKMPPGWVPLRKLTWKLSKNDTFSVGHPWDSNPIFGVKFHCFFNAGGWDDFNGFQRGTVTSNSGTIAASTIGFAWSSWGFQRRPKWKAWSEECCATKCV